MKPLPAMANWYLNATNCVKFAVNAGGHPAFIFIGDVCLAPDDDHPGDHDDDRHDDRDDYYSAAAVRMDASDCLAIHNFCATSRGHASNRHPSRNRDNHDRQSVTLLMAPALFPQPALP